MMQYGIARASDPYWFMKGLVGVELINLSLNEYNASSKHSHYVRKVILVYTRLLHPFYALVHHRG